MSENIDDYLSEKVWECEQKLRRRGFNKMREPLVSASRPDFPIVDRPYGMREVTLMPEEQFLFLWRTYGRPVHDSLYDALGCAAQDLTAVRWEAFEKHKQERHWNNPHKRLHDAAAEAARVAVHTRELLRQRRLTEKLYDILSRATNDEIKEQAMVLGWWGHGSIEEADKADEKLNDYGCALIAARNTPLYMLSDKSDGEEGL